MVGGIGEGTVFEIKNTGSASTPVYASAPTTLFSFNGYYGSNGYYPNGYFPDAALIADANGNLFSTTDQGGSAGYGTVFEIIGDAGFSFVPPP